MRRIFASVATICLTTAITFLPSLFGTPLHPLVAITMMIGGAVLGMCTLIFGRDSWLRRLRSRRRRGVISVGAVDSREVDFARPWKDSKAGDKILCLGVGMSSVVRNTATIRAAVARSVDVTFVMVDPEWVAENPEIRAAYERYYDTSALLFDLRDSSRLLEELAASVRKGGIEIIRYREFNTTSATINGWLDTRPFGAFEAHLWGNSKQRVRVNIARDSSPGDQDVVEDVIDMAKRLIDRSRRLDVATQAQPEEAVVVLTRVPKSNLSKTRLANQIGRGAATRAAFELLDQTTRNALLTELGVACLFSGDRVDFDGREHEGVTYARVGDADVSAMQSLDAAVAWCRDRGRQRVAIVPSDAPTVEPALIHRMLSDLAGADVVICPSNDGGIAAIAVHAGTPLRFSQIAGSSGRVMTDVERQAAVLGLSVTKVPGRTDIDDLSSLREVLAAGQLKADNPLVAILGLEAPDGPPTAEGEYELD